jgi:hypothetical protein
VNRFLSLFLSLALVLAGAAGGLGTAPAAEPPAEAMDCCDSQCPCTPPPAPAGNRQPVGAATPVAPAAQAAPAHRSEPGEPAPDWIRGTGPEGRAAAVIPGPEGQPRGRDPDLGRHLAHLRHLRI